MGGNGGNDGEGRELRGRRGRAGIGGVRSAVKCVGSCIKDAITYTGVCRSGDDYSEDEAYGFDCLHAGGGGEEFSVELGRGIIV